MKGLALPQLHHLAKNIAQSFGTDVHNGYTFIFDNSGSDKTQNTWIETKNSKAPKQIEMLSEREALPSS